MNNSKALDRLADLSGRRIKDIIETASEKTDWDAVDEALAITVQKVRNGKLSPLAYYMQKNLMDVPALATKSYFSRLEVYLHLRPFVFKRLSKHTLQLYAAIFNISVDALMNIDQ